MCVQRKLNKEESARVRTIFNGNGALMLLDNAICDRKTEARASTNFLCGEKRIKDSLLKSRRICLDRYRQNNLHDIQLSVYRQW